jgi:hypothetical protein
MNSITDFGFYSVEELQELADSDLSFEIADAALLNTPEADVYLDSVIAELQRRATSETVH